MIQIKTTWCINYSIVTHNRESNLPNKIHKHNEEDENVENNVFKTISFHDYCVGKRAGKMESNLQKT